MSEFFKAATRCDPSAADKSPVYVDRAAIMEEQFRTQRLVEQTMRTELLLREIEQQHAREEEEKRRAEAAEESRSDPFFRYHNSSTASRSDAVTPEYKAPPQCTGHLLPEYRHEGSRAVYKSLNDRANLWRQKLNESREAILSQEAREAVNESKQYAHRQKEAEREFNALVVSRQIAARENELSRVRSIEVTEQAKRRVHPIDVLHQRIAEELMRDVTDASEALTEQLAIDAVPIERVYEDEQLRAIREYRRNPTTHIPDATNVAR